MRINAAAMGDASYDYNEGMSEIQDTMELKRVPLILDIATSKGKFELGEVVVTRGVHALLQDEYIRKIDIEQNITWKMLLEVNAPLNEILKKHIKGDWGDMCKEDKEANEEALKYGSRLISCYKLYDTKVWVITEWNRSITTVLLPEEY